MTGKIQPICCTRDMLHCYSAQYKKTKGWHCQHCKKWVEAGPIAPLIDINGQLIESNHCGDTPC